MSTFWLVTVPVGITIIVIVIIIIIIITIIGDKQSQAAAFEEIKDHITSYGQNGQV